MTVTGRRLQLVFAGGPDDVVKTAARYHVLDIRTRGHDLEDIFLRYYRHQAEEPDHDDQDERS